MKNNDNIEKMLAQKADSVKIPDKLEPENVCEMLKNQTAAKHKVAPKKRVAMRFAAGATAFAALLVTMGFAAKNTQVFDSSQLKANKNTQSNTSQSGDISSVNVIENTENASYTDIYKTLEIAKNKVYFDDSDGFSIIGGIFGSSAKNETGAATTDDMQLESDSIETAGDDNLFADDMQTGLGGESDDYSETITQVEGIDEADIVKTNGSEIFYIVDNTVYSIAVENGVFSQAQIIFGQTLADYEYIANMYIAQDKLAIITETHNSSGFNEELMVDTIYCTNDVTTTVYFIATDGSDVHSYAQSGQCSDSRMIDNTLLIITNDDSKSLSNIDRRSRPSYLPSYYCDGSEEYVPAADIVVSEDITELSYCIAASIDITAPESPKAIKAFAGSSSNVYCSAENLYITSYCYDYDEYRTYTKISRLSLADNLEIKAQSKVVGTVLNQYSMDEYNGYFRAAVCYNKQNDDMTLGTESAVVIFDMSLNEVGRCDGLGVGETLRSVRFSGETAYVVTFMQTDPLYAIDLSDPTNPVMLDEFKVSGYSTYLHPYKDNLMLSFGVEADEVTGQTNGLKLMMYDTSDPDNLVLLDSYVWEDTEEYFDGVDENGVYTWYDNYCWYDSAAVWDEKALFIDAQRNIIGIPIYYYNYYQDENEYTDTMIAGYYIFTFTDDGFSQVFVTTCAENEYSLYNSNFNRAVRIGEYLYALSPYRLISVNLSDFSTVDTLENFAQ